MFAKFPWHFLRRISKQVSQRLLPGVPPPSGQQRRQSVLHVKFLSIPSQNGCCGPSVRLLPSLPSQETQVSRKVAGRCSHIEVLEVFSSEFAVQKRSDQTQLCWDDVFKHSRTCGIDRVSNQAGKTKIFLESCPSCFQCRVDTSKRG